MAKNGALLKQKISYAFIIVGDRVVLLHCKKFYTCHPFRDINKLS